MGLAKQFEDIVHRQLNVHAAWMPVTTPYKLGDYGLISDGVFQKLGNINEFNVSFTEATGQETKLRFVSEGSTVVDANTGAEINLNAHELKANVTYKFSREKSLLLEAPVVNVSTIDNVGQVARQLKRASGWRKRHTVIYQIYTAQNPLILATNEGGTEATLSGEGSAPNQFHIGRGLAKFGLKTNKELSLEISGKTGAIALGLFKLKRFFGTTQFSDSDGEANVEDLNGQKLANDI